MNPTKDNTLSLDFNKYSFLHCWDSCLTSYCNITRFFRIDENEANVAKIPVFKRSQSILAPDVVLVARTDIPKYSELIWSPH